jgi:hypothetical protein
MIRLANVNFATKKNSEMTERMLIVRNLEINQKLDNITLKNVISVNKEIKWKWKTQLAQLFLSTTSCFCKKYVYFTASP